jgi:hypothetical protein
MRNITDIIGELVGRISSGLVAERLETIETTTKFWTCDVGYARVGAKLGGLEILEVGSNYIIVQGALVGLTQSLHPPTYKHGTVIHVNQENLTDGNAYEEVYPMIYFPETIGETERYNSRLDNREMSASIRLIFAQRYVPDWTTDQFTSECINPMLQLYDRFKKVVEADYFISPKRDIRWRERHFPILGNYATDKGYTNDWFDDKVGGVVVEFNMEVYKSFTCSCCGCDIPDAPIESNNWVDNEGNQFVDNEGNELQIIN